MNNTIIFNKIAQVLADRTNLNREITPEELFGTTRRYPNNIYSEYMGDNGYNPNTDLVNNSSSTSWPVVSSLSSLL